jgi:maleate isomerase
LSERLPSASVDALLISCAGIQLASHLDAIERRFGRPVVASNQALLWYCLRVLGIETRCAGYGALLAGEFNR